MRLHWVKQRGTGGCPCAPSLTLGTTARRRERAAAGQEHLGARLAVLERRVKFLESGAPLQQRLEWDAPLLALPATGPTPQSLSGDASGGWGTQPPAYGNACLPLAPPLPQLGPPYAGCTTARLGSSSGSSAGTAAPAVPPPPPLPAASAPAAELIASLTARMGSAAAALECG